MSLENPEKIIAQSNKREATKMEGGKENNEQEWKKAIDETLHFARKTMAWNPFTGERMSDEELEEKELIKIKELENILGEDTVKYLGMKEATIIGLRHLTSGKRDKKEDVGQKVYERILNLTPEELQAEVKEYISNLNRKTETENR